MTQQVEMIGRYKHLRQVGLVFNLELTKILSTSEIHEGGRQLGILEKGTLVLGNEDEIGVLMDFCLHDVRRNGINALERCLAESPPPPESDEMVILQGKIAARYSLFMVEALEPGIGVKVRDLLYEEDLLVTDLGFSTSAEVGLVIAFRVMTVDGIHMTTGAALPVVVVPPGDRAEFVRDQVSQFKKLVSPSSTPAQKSDFAASMIRTCLRKGAASHIRYADLDEKPRHKRQAPPARPATRVISAKKRVVGPNDRCPCGSGRKLKNCCGSQHQS